MNATLDWPMYNFLPKASVQTDAGNNLPTQMYKGCACVFPYFSGKGVFLDRLSREDCPMKNLKRGCCLNQSPKIWGNILEASREMKKKGYDLYIHVSRAFNYLPRNGGRALIILYCISVVEPPRVMVKYVHIFPEPEEKKRKGIRVTVWSRDRGSTGQVR